jgi:surfeit locus 1 family protein
MHEKESLRARYDAAAALPPVALAELALATDWSALRYRAVTAAGEFDARRQIFLDNRVHDGRAGYDVITPLVQADGRAVLVDRGWVAQGATRAELPPVAPPAGRVTVRGRIALPVTNAFQLTKDVADGPVWQRVDPARFAAATGMAVLPVLLEATEAPTPATNDGLVRDRAAPDFGAEKHEIYMVQWYAFAALAIVLWAIFHLRGNRPRRDGRSE